MRRPLAALALVLAAFARPATAAAPAPGRLTGRVVDASGAPVARFTVNDVVFTGTEGRYEVNLAIGESRLVFRAPGAAPAVVLVHATERGTSGRRFVLPDLVAGRGAELIGEVLDAETGLPVVAARAALAAPLDAAATPRPERLSDLGSSGNGGIFLLKRAAKGESLLVVHHPDYLPAMVRVSTRKPLPTVLLQRGGTIDGTARDAAGRPIPNARVLAVCDAASDAQEVRADATGAFALRKLRPGTYTVVARGAFGLSALAETVEVRDGEETSVQLVAAPVRGGATRVAAVR